MRAQPAIAPHAAGVATTLVDVLQWRAARQRDDLAFSFLHDGETPSACATYGELDARGRCVAQSLIDLAPAGSRAILAYPQGLEFIVAFYAALYAGMVGVPVVPPDSPRGKRLMESVVRDAEPRLILTTAALRADACACSEHLGVVTLATDHGAHAEPGGAPPRPPAPRSAAYLQYTSGSTGRPKGVLVGHDNLMAHLPSLAERVVPGPDTTGVSWLPHFHDMGLIMGLLLPIFCGYPAQIMSPLAFVQRPARWLRAISDLAAGISGGPNFAYDLCVARVDPAEAGSFDLSSWACAFNAAERVRPETLERFSRAFRRSGFRRSSFVPAYGLAEATLGVTAQELGRGPVMCSVDGAMLRHGVALECPESHEHAARLAGCGRLFSGTCVKIVDPSTRAPVEDRRVAEVWVRGSSVASGYWNRTGDTTETFEATCDGDSRGPFLRTGDLGFMNNGELFIAGRLKDLLVIRGQNYDPDDLEQTVESAHPAVRPGCCAAVACDADGAEGFAIFAEVRASTPGVDGLVRRSIREALVTHYGLAPHAIELLAPRTLPKTSSGKIMRHALREARLGTPQEAAVVAD